MKAKAKTKRKVATNKLPYEIIKVVQKNIRHLLENPKHLAWCLLCYDQMHTASRHAGSETDNPKYIFLDDQEKEWPGLSEHELEVLYWAWGAGVANGLPQDFLYDKAPRPNMTLEDWVESQCNPDYPYYSLFKTRHRVVDGLFTNSGFSWNKEGYLVHGRGGIDESMFYGFSQAENLVDPKIRKAIKNICADPRVKKHFDNRYNATVQYNLLNAKHQEIFRREIMDFSQNKEFTSGCYLELIDKIKTGVFDNETERDSIYRRLKIPMSEEIKKALDKGEEDRKKEEKKEQKQREFVFYPFSEGYNRFSDMPANAHPSYVKEAMKVCRLIADGKGLVYSGGHGTKEKYAPAHPEMVKICKKFIAKWEPRGY